MVPEKLTLYLGLAAVVTGLAGVIGHSVAFDTQISPVLNTFVSSWYAGFLFVCGVFLLYLRRKSSSSNAFYYWSELAFLVWLMCCSLVSFVCYGLVRDWSAFAWILVTFIPLSACLYIRWLNPKKYAALGRKCDIFAGVIFAVQLVVMFIAALLAAGGISSAFSASFPAPGRFISVYFDGANRNASLQVYCIGTTNSSQATIFLVSSSAHGIVDFYGLQFYLNSINGTDRRVCSFDRLGFGWSQDAFADQFSNYQFVYNLFLATGEPSPWNVVGWGEGGSILAYLASQYSSSIKSVTFLEAYPPGVEFDAYGYMNGLDQTAVTNYRNDQLRSRLGIARLILFLVIPWGLTSLFFPMSPADPDFYPSSRWPEYRVQLWKSKSWISQMQGIQAMQTRKDKDDPVFIYAPLPNVPVLGVYCNVTTCFNRYGNLTGQACIDKIKKDAYSNDQKFSMIQALSNNVTIVTNKDVDCGLDLPLKRPRLTAESILGLYSKVNA